MDQITNICMRSKEVDLIGLIYCRSIKKIKLFVSGFSKVLVELQQLSGIETMSMDN